MDLNPIDQFNALRFLGLTLKDLNEQKYTPNNNIWLNFDKIIRLLIILI